MNTMHCTSAERINAIASQLGGAERYLEIGVARGTTFFSVNAKYKHAVDPRFRFNIETRRLYSNEFYHSCTSDEFFANYPAESPPFDIIFLDGLHTYSQTLRDFMASQSLSHSRTVWLIDDTIPSCAIAADPDLSRVRRARELKGEQDDQTWMGDVFKLIAFIDSFCPQFMHLTTEGHGQTVVFSSVKQESTKRFSSLSEIDSLSYVDSVLLSDSLYKKVNFNDILRAISA